MPKYITEEILEQKLSVALKEAFDDFSVKIFRYFREFENRIDERFAAVDVRFDRLERIIDGHSKQLGDNEVENAARDSKLDRHERWIGQLADKTKTQLEY